MFDSGTPRLQVVAQGSVPTAIPLRVLENETLARALERHEGMRVRLDADSALKISRNFSYDYAARRNNLVLSHQAPLMKPTQLHDADSKAAKALAKANAGNRVFLESDFKAADGNCPGCRPGSRSRVTCASAMPRSIWTPWWATATTSTG